MKTDFRTISFTSALLTGFVLPIAASAQQPAEPYPAPPATEKAKKPKRILTPEEKAEKAQRRICKVQICSIFSTKDPQGADIDCPIVKTWREEDIEDILGGKLDWPWGKARCTAQLKLNRAVLVAAADADGTVAKLEKHTITCSLDLKSDEESYDVKIDISPEVTFAGGKAKSARMNWGAIDAPMLAYSVIWPGAKLDNSLNVLGGQVVKMTNEFMGKKCDALKDILPKRASYSPVPR
jgi:hypothetical protein